MSTVIYVLLGLGLLAFGIHLIIKNRKKVVEKPVEEYTPVTMAGDYDGDPIEKELFITEGISAQYKEVRELHVNINKEQEKELEETLKKDKSTAVFQRFDTKKEEPRLINPTTTKKNKNNGNVYNEAIMEVGTEIPSIIGMHYGIENNHQESKVIIEDVETKRPIMVEGDAPVWSRSDINDRVSNNDNNGIKTESGAPKWEANDTSYKQPSHTPSYRSNHNHHDNSNDYNSGSSHRSSYSHDNDTSKWTPSSGGSHGGGIGESISDAVSSIFD